MEQITVRIPEEELAELEAEADEHGVSRSEHIRTVLESRHEEAKESSVVNQHDTAGWPVCWLKRLNRPNHRIDDAPPNKVERRPDLEGVLDDVIECDQQSDEC